MLIYVNNCGVDIGYVFYYIIICSIL